MRSPSPHTRSGGSPARKVVRGTTWFGAMVAIWSVFYTLLAVSPGTLEDVYSWLRDLWIVWQILMWIVLLPWALAWVVWETSWEQWLRILVMALLTAVHLLVSAPRVRR